jgi:hypothetical protein
MNELRKPNDAGERLKIFTGLVVTAFAVALAVVIGNRLSDQALAVLAGAVCGVGAAIPTSLLIVAVTRRHEESRARPTMYPPATQGAYPPVIVVAPPGAQPGPNAWNALPPAFNSPTPRQFTVVGGSPVDAETAPYHYSGMQ